MGPPRSPGVGARHAGRFAHPGGARGLRAQHRELHRHRQGAGRPGRAAARQRRPRARRLLRAAGDHRGRAGRLLLARRAAHHRRRRLRGRRAQRRRHARAGRSRSRRSATPRCSSPGRRMSFEAFKRPRRNDAARRARRHAAHRRGQPRACPVRVHDRRCLGPEHGDDCRRRDLPLHRGAHAGAAAILVRRSEHVRRQESDDALLHVGPRQEGQRRSHRPGGARRGASAHDRATRWSTTRACR